MVFLRPEVTLDNETMLSHSRLLRQLASLEFACVYHQNLRKTDPNRLFGDEIEYMILKPDHKNRKLRLLPAYPHIASYLQSQPSNPDSHTSLSSHGTVDTTQSNINSQVKQDTGPDSTVVGDLHNSVNTNTVKDNSVNNDVDLRKCIFTPEYASYMVESIPDEPYRLFSDFLPEVENSVLLRRRRLERILALLPFDETKVATLSNFFRLGCEDCVFYGDSDFRKPFENTLKLNLSEFFPNICITPISRFTEITNNIRIRRSGTKIYVRKYNPQKSTQPQLNSGSDTVNPIQPSSNTSSQCKPSLIHSVKDTVNTNSVESSVDMDKIGKFDMLSLKQKKLVQDLIQSHTQPQHSSNHTQLDKPSSINLVHTVDTTQPSSHSEVLGNSVKPGELGNMVDSVYTELVEYIKQKVVENDPLSTNYNQLNQPSLRTTSHTKHNQSNFNTNQPDESNKLGKLVDSVENTVNNTEDNMIYMDSVGFGMGMSCLQVTFSCLDLSEARFLHDQFVVLTPIFLALSASTVAFRGFLADSDTRWNALEQAMDDLSHDRVAIVRSRYSTNSLFVSNSDFCLKNYKYLNDVKVACDSDSYFGLVKLGVDPILSRHLAHNFVYQPLVVYREDFGRVECDKTDSHYQVFHTTNWTSVRLNHPKLYTNPLTKLPSSNTIQHSQSSSHTSSNTTQLGDSVNNKVNLVNTVSTVSTELSSSQGLITSTNSVNNTNPINSSHTSSHSEVLVDRGDKVDVGNSGPTELSSSQCLTGLQSELGLNRPVTDGVSFLPWRVEFRPMDIQLTDEENVMFIATLSCLTRTILTQRLNLYLPISLVDENVKRANKVEAYKSQLFHFRTEFGEGKIELGEFSLYEILFGKVGLFNLVLGQLESDFKLGLISRKSLLKIREYLAHFKQLSLGEVETNAGKLRRFVTRHQDYKDDGIISDSILYDLIYHFT